MLGDFVPNKELALSRIRKQSLVDGEHWLFAGMKNGSRYGYITINSRKFIVSRLSLAIHRGLDYNDLSWEACHKSTCRFRHCWNPEHLEKGNPSKNTLDSVRDGTHNMARKTHCKRGHEFTPENTYLINGMRHCRQCRNEAQKRYYRRSNA
jgi:hypothetical protein